MAHGRRRRPRSGRTAAVCLVVVAAVGAAGAAAVALTAGGGSDPGSRSTGALVQPNREIDPAELGLKRLRHESVGLDGPACVTVPARGRATATYAITSVADAPRAYRMTATEGGVRVRGLPSRITLRAGETRRFAIVVVARSGAAVPAADPFVQIDATSMNDPADAQSASTEIALGAARAC